MFCVCIMMEITKIILIMKMMNMMKMVLMIIMVICQNVPTSPDILVR